MLYGMSRPHRLKWLGAGLACVGTLLLLYACALLAWQYASRIETGAWVALPANVVFAAQTGKLAPIAAFVPDLPAAWRGEHIAVTWVLEHLHIGVPFAVIGVILLAIGALMTSRQNAIIRMEERAAADRLRRVRLGQYGDPDRREPYIGPGIPEIPERTRKAA